ncbi:hypothetical protein V2H45_23435 [Tumidithrix elongata RA019]|uniref:Phage protein n=1 Tax=Tumidithrix elongata BACA0141 TaxID=2716417 RepID=A0AAW9Q6Y0_9CYAN|nr:hypothetical protein [Tumidithrix elongata RA019]
MNNQPNNNNLRIDTSAIAQGMVLTALVALTTTVLQLRQDVALMRDQMSNMVVAKEFAAFKAISEQHDLVFEKRLEQLEQRLEEKKK